PRLGFDDWRRWNHEVFVLRRSRRGAGLRLLLPRAPSKSPGALLDSRAFVEGFSWDRARMGQERGGGANATLHFADGGLARREVRHAICPVRYLDRPLRSRAFEQAGYAVLVLGNHRFDLLHVRRTDAPSFV